MLDVGLADRIRSKGVPVSEVAGWQIRGRTYAEHRPRGGVNHHTAGSSRGATPSLATIIYGRPGLPGPLAHVLQSREVNPAEDRAYVVAAGLANHAGSGSWHGLTGNPSVAGLEVEHVGTHAVDPRRLETSARIMAALIEAPGSPRSAALVCQHFEWTSRKIDFYSLAPWTPDQFRARVAYWIGRTAEEEDMPLTDQDLRRIRDQTRRGVGDGMADVKSRLYKGTRNASKEGVDASGVADSVEALADRPHTQLVAADDWVDGEAVWMTDWVVRAKVEHGGSYHEWLRDLAKFIGRSPNAARIPRAVLEEIPVIGE